MAFTVQAPVHYLIFSLYSFRYQTHTDGLRTQTPRKPGHSWKPRMQSLCHIWRGVAWGRTSRNASPSYGTTPSIPAPSGEVTATSSSWTQAYRIRGEGEGFGVVFPSFLIVFFCLSLPPMPCLLMGTLSTCSFPWLILHDATNSQNRLMNKW